MKRLRDHGLTPACIAKTPAAELESILIPVSFYKVRSSFVSILDAEVWEGILGNGLHWTEYSLVNSTLWTAHTLQPVLPEREII